MHKCMNLTDIIVKATRYQMKVYGMVLFTHISNSLNESIVLEIRIAVNLVRTVILGKGLEEDFEDAN